MLKITRFYIMLCNVWPSQVEPQKPRQWKSMLIHQGWFTVLYTQHLLDSQSFEFEICILQALSMPLIRCTNAFFKGGYPVTLLPPPKRLVPSLGLGTTAATKCNERPSQATANPVSGKACSSTKASLLCYILNTYFTRFTKFRV